jgi:hypothetical protein
VIALESRVHKEWKLHTFDFLRMAREIDNDRKSALGFSRGAFVGRWDMEGAMSKGPVERFLRERGAISLLSAR